MGYKVTGSKQIKTMTQAGTTVTQYRVWISTEKGASGYIDVDAEDWNADKLREILGDFAAELDLAFSLGE